MISTKNTQSLTDFRQKATETLDRLNKTGEAEILTVNGEARAVLLAPAAYDELSRELDLARDVNNIRIALGQFEAGQGRDAEAFFDELRQRLSAKKRRTRRK